MRGLVAGEPVGGARGMSGVLVLIELLRNDTHLCIMMSSSALGMKPSMPSAIGDLKLESATFPKCRLSSARVIPRHEPEPQGVHRAGWCIVCLLIYVSFLFRPGCAHYNNEQYPFFADLGRCLIGTRSESAESVSWLRRGVGVSVGLAACIQTPSAAHAQHYPRSRTPLERSLVHCSHS